jgi:beta-lactam-binding protein with PASTA domain
MSNTGIQIIFVIVGGLIMGLGISMIWNNPTQIKRPKTDGKKREYYTWGEMFKQRLKNHFRRGKDA